MSKKQNMKQLKPLKELNLTDRFLFDEVMEDPQTHQDVLSIIFGREIPLLEKNETEKEMRVSPLIRSIRMDVFAMDEEQIVYNTEMQAQRRNDLAKRSRYYQALVDSSLLNPGIPDYNLLNRSYIIMIMPYDLFGYGRYQYTFEAKCVEEPECMLNDGATRIFLNTKGKNDTEVSAELAEFLHYAEHTTNEAAEETESKRIKRIHNRVCKVKASEQVGVKYMQAWEERYYELEKAKREAREEGCEVGRDEGARAKLKELVDKKYKKGKNAEEIADDFEETLELIEELIREIKCDTEE